MKKVFALLFSAVLLLNLAGCGSKETPVSETSSSAAGNPAVSENAAPASGDSRYADIEIRDYGTITVELNRDAAPLTVDNFVKLAESGFY